MWFLDFTSVMLHKQFENESEKLKNSVSHAYDTTLAQYHGWVLRKTISVSLEPRRLFWQYVTAPILRRLH